MCTSRVTFEMFSYLLRRVNVEYDKVSEVCKVQKTKRIPLYQNSILAPGIKLRHANVQIRKMDINKFYEN
jgi:hypothetical protein